jgi:dimethylargininase
MLVAITREVSRNIGQCELSHIERKTIDASTAAEQHRAYEDCLISLGCELVRLPEEPDMPDSVFIEDTAVVLDEVAIITRPGAASRRRETMAAKRALAMYRRIDVIEPPGTLDGGDVLSVGKRVFIGLSERSNQVAIAQLRSMLEPHGYQVEGVNVQGCLHLKSAVTQVGDRRLLVNRNWVDMQPFVDYEILDVDPSEPYGANALLVADVLIYPEAYPRTRNRLKDAGIDVRPVDLSELAKAEGGVTCCSLIFPA